MVGSARLRQLRARTDSCRIAGLVHNLVPDCEALYSWDVEEMGSYTPGWKPPVKTAGKDDRLSPWRYQSEAELRSHLVWGRLALYRGGGFVATLGPTRRDASRCVEKLQVKHNKHRALLHLDDSKTCLIPTKYNLVHIIDIIILIAGDFSFLPWELMGQTGIIFTHPHRLLIMLMLTF